MNIKPLSSEYISQIEKLCTDMQLPRPSGDLLEALATGIDTTGKNRTQDHVCYIATSDEGHLFGFVLAKLVPGKLPPKLSKANDTPRLGNPYIGTVLYLVLRDAKVKKRLLSEVEKATKKKKLEGLSLRLDEAEVEEFHKLGYRARLVNVVAGGAASIVAIKYFDSREEDCVPPVVIPIGCDSVRTTLQRLGYQTQSHVQRMLF